MDSWNGSAAYLVRQAKRESSARTYPRRLPVAIDQASGLEVRAVDGRVYLDCLMGAGTLALGHNHPAVLDAMRELLDEGAPLHLLDLPTPVKDEFTTELLDSLPPHFAEHALVQFCGPTGADAVEAALKLTKTATGRRSVVAFQGGYHGMTHGALAITGETGPKAAVAGMMSEVHFAPFPATYRCPFGIGGEESARVAAHYLEDMLQNPQSGVVLPAAVVVEVVQGEGGCRPAPDEWLREVRRITSEHSVPLVVDEVQTGVGRTGTMWAFERAGIIPDVVCMSKAVGGGQPLALMVYHRSLDRWEPGAHAGTFRGNQLAMAAGSTTLKYIRKESLSEAAAERGAQLQQRLEAVRTEAPVIAEVRGRGLMIGVEMVDASCSVLHSGRGGLPPAPDLARAVQRECLERGLMIELGGRHNSVVRFLPPLTITEAQVDEVADRFEAAVRAVVGK